MPSILIAPDKFKNTLAATEVADEIASVIRETMPDATIRICPMADGGEGTTEALTRGLGGRQISVAVTGPEGKPVTASYGYLEENRTAVMEMAAAAISLKPRKIAPK